MPSGGRPRAPLGWQLVEVDAGLGFREGGAGNARQEPRRRSREGVNESGWEMEPAAENARLVGCDNDSTLSRVAQETGS
jgi:hypothetical protein